MLRRLRSYSLKWEEKWLGDFTKVKKEENFKEEELD